MITFNCYGVRVPGQAGAASRTQNTYCTRWPEPDPVLESLSRARMDQSPYLLDQIRREAVVKSIQQVSIYRGWELRAAHARTEHVHAVVLTKATPIHVMRDFKAYASRRLNALGVDPSDRKRW